jgi:hypothetical protein
LLIPSPDAIAEFNMVTNTINAEYGRNSGAILNAAIKSGTNSFHGDRTVVQAHDPRLIQLGAKFYF